MQMDLSSCQEELDGTKMHHNADALSEDVSLLYTQAHKEAFRDDLNKSSAACDHSVERELL